MKNFIITVDTEGDNMWNWFYDGEITTENALYVPRFQELCESYGYKPTYLVNYEMAKDDRFVGYMKGRLKQKQCEIGMHLHAWNSPPINSLPIRNDGVKPGKEFLIEHPYDLMEEKVNFLTTFLEKRFEKRPVSHRAGRWAMNKEYAQILYKAGYSSDCSVIPGNSACCAGYTNGSYCEDYSSYPHKPFNLYDSGVLEIPVTTCLSHRIDLKDRNTVTSKVKGIMKAYIRPKQVMFRPKGNNCEDMLYLANRVRRSDDDYLMFVIHSSELMPGCNPIFDTKEKIEKLYQDLDTLFKNLSNDFVGCTLSDYSCMLMERKNERF